MNKHKIIYSSKLIPDFDYTYFSIPVYLIKAILTIKTNADLDHFERAVLSLQNCKNHLPLELSEMLCLDRSLIDLIIHSLQEKNYLSSKNRITEKGKNALISNESETEDKIIYAFYDINRNTILNTLCESSDFIITETSEHKYKFSIQNDAVDEDIYFTELKAKNRVDLRNYLGDINKMLYRSSKLEVTNIQIVDYSFETFDLITYIKKDKSLKTTNFIVCDPITLENNQDLYYYLYSNLKNPVIANIVKNAINKNNNYLVKKEYEDEKNLKLIKEKLFNKPLSDFHNYFIEDIYETIKALNDVESESFNMSVMINDQVKHSMIHMGKLFENVLYQAAAEFKNSSNYIHNVNNSANLKEELLLIADKLGFDISDEAKSLLNVNKRNLEKMLRQPDKKNLGECIAYNLLISIKNPNYYFNKLVKDYPELINNLYTFKREYRDTNKHGTGFSTLSPGIYFNILFKIMEYGLGYKLNEKILEELYVTKDENSSVAYAEAVLKSELPDVISQSNDAFITKIRQTLLNLLTAYFDGQPDFIDSAYSLVDDILKELCRFIKASSKCEFIPLNELFKTKQEIIAFLKKNNFQVEPLEGIDSNLENLISNNSKAEISFETNFTNSVLNSEVVCLIMMMKQNENVVKTLKKFKTIFVLASALSKIVGHQNNVNFNTDIAVTIKDEIMKTVNNLAYILN